MTDAVFAGGQPSHGSSSEDFDVVNPANDEVVERIRIADASDVDRAVASAAAAFGDWSRAAPVERSSALHRLAAILEGRAKEYALVP